ncbi:hypothetical protein A3195_02480 [Candidatus Thiodiazotropha endoloripes]|nr:GNAT family N-acetyltransferase [Candidatus Thiodiazotropha endoloripes]MCG7901030.1 GNAT family N-acetyltransferase [Candidatus Thiodiazotropha weberae]MCG7913371.1 GNAT family N-acetyltransferase [Candidatus Thiodiazotropha weberae]ODB84661.1 hypothetical protein A3193_17970 [Candidatus Thiodiazotropha endoloripes]ODB90373.1 hypothetical protein A3195_02480 [Candidatus Thiodiazotropha endoloripes]
MKNRWFALWWHRFLRNIWLQFIANPEALKVRMQSDGFVLVAVQDDTIVGMLEFCPPNMVALLFVTVRHQGIAKNYWLVH